MELGIHTFWQVLNPVNIFSLHLCLINVLHCEELLITKK
jgi:hypothetical protein